MRRRSEGYFAAAYHFCSAVMGARYRLCYSGAENIPRQGTALILPKHQSMEDIIHEGIFFMKHLRRGAYWVMRKSGLPKVLERLGGVAINRPCDLHKILDREERRKAIEAAKAENDAARGYVKLLYRNGELVVVHPEGTRSPGRIGKVRSDFIDLARAVQEDCGIRIPAIPMGIEYTPNGEVFVRAGEPLDVSQPGIVEAVEEEMRRLSNIRGQQ